MCNYEAQKSTFPAFSALIVLREEITVPAKGRPPAFFWGGGVGVGGEIVRPLWVRTWVTKNKYEMKSVRGRPDDT